MQIYVDFFSNEGAHHEFSVMKCHGRRSDENTSRKKLLKNVIFFLTLIFGKSIPSCNCNIYVADSMSHRKGRIDTMATKKAAKKAPKKAAKKTAKKKK